MPLIVIIKQLICLTCIVMLGGCAIMKQDNRILLNALDNAVNDSFVTASTTSKIVSAPVIAPAAIGAGILDMTVITPSRAVAPAVDDTNDILWKNPQGSDIRQAMLFLPKTVATPIVFLGSWTARSLFTSDM